MPKARLAPTQGPSEPWLWERLAEGLDTAFEVNRNDEPPVVLGHPGSPSPLRIVSATTVGDRGGRLISTLQSRCRA